MDCVNIVLVIYKIGNEIYSISKDIHANKKACETLTERTKSLMDCLGTLQQSPESSSHINSSYGKALQHLLNVFEEIHNFIPKFRRPTDANMFEIASWYAKLANSRSRDQASFVEYNDQLTQCSQDLQLGLSIENISSKQHIEDVMEDLQLIRQDLLEYMTRKDLSLDNSSRSRFEGILDEITATVRSSSSLFSLLLAS